MPCPSQPPSPLPHPQPQKQLPNTGQVPVPSGAATPGSPLTIFSAAVLLMKRDPCPGLPTHFTLIPAATGDEGEALRRSLGCTQHPDAEAPGRAKEGVVGGWLLTPGALFTVEDAEGVGGAGQAWGGHREVSEGHREAGTAGGTAWGGPVGPQRPGEGVMPTCRGCQMRKDPLGVPGQPCHRSPSSRAKPTLSALNSGRCTNISMPLCPPTSSSAERSLLGRKASPSPAPPRPPSPPAALGAGHPLSPELGESQIPAGRRKSPM